MMAELKEFGLFRFSTFPRLFRLLYLTLISSFFQFQASFQRRKILFCLSVLGPIHSIALYLRNIFATFSSLVTSISCFHQAGRGGHLSCSQYPPTFEAFPSSRGTASFIVLTVINQLFFHRKRKNFLTKFFFFSSLSFSYFPSSSSFPIVHSPFVSRLF